MHWMAFYNAAASSRFATSVSNANAQLCLWSAWHQLREDLRVQCSFPPFDLSFLFFPPPKYADAVCYVRNFRLRLLVGASRVQCAVRFGACRCYIHGICSSNVDCCVDGGLRTCPLFFSNFFFSPLSPLEKAIPCQILLWFCSIMVLRFNNSLYLLHDVVRRGKWNERRTRGCEERLFFFFLWWYWKTTWTVEQLRLIVVHNSVMCCLSSETWRSPHCSTPCCVSSSLS